MTCNTKPRVTSRVERWTVGRGRIGISIWTVTRHRWCVASQVSDRLRRDGCGEFVGCDSLRDEITLNPDLKLRERTSGGEIAHEGFAGMGLPVRIGRPGAAWFPSDVELAEG